MLLEESLMLTGDENIVDINFSVFWVINDAGKYLFKLRNPDASIKSISESVMREVIGNTPIADALAERRQEIENRFIRKMWKTQKIEKQTENTKHDKKQAI